MLLTQKNDQMLSVIFKDKKCKNCRFLAISVCQGDIFIPCVLDSFANIINYDAVRIVYLDCLHHQDIVEFAS